MRLYADGCDPKYTAADRLARHPAPDHRPTPRAALGIDLPRRPRRLLADAYDGLTIRYESA